MRLKSSAVPAVKDCSFRTGRKLKEKHIMNGMLLTVIMFVFIAVCLLTNKIAGSVACGIAVMVLWFAGVLEDGQVFANFITSSIVSLIGMMIVTNALIKTDILVNIAGTVKKFKGGIYIILLASMIVPYFLSQFVGGVTAMIAVIPLAMALAAESDIAPTLVVLPASVGAQAGLMGLPIGSASVMYQLKNQILISVGIEDQAIGFWDLCLGRLPATLLIMAFVILIGWKLLPARGLSKSDAVDPNSKGTLKKSTMPKSKQYMTYAIFAVTLVLLSIARNIGLNSMMITTTAALLVILLGIMKDREAFTGVNWSLIFMMGFMLAIASALTNSGAGEKIADLLNPVYGKGNTFLAVAVTFLVCVVMTQFMDNLSLINILTPICAIAAYQNGIPVVPIVLAIDASCLVSFSTPMASPSSLLAYQMGGYSMKEMLIFNLPLILIAIVVSILWIPMYCAL